jgi:molybdenum cofactor biosynthesis protein B
VRDEPTHVAAAVQAFVSTADVDAVLITGGTGIAARDNTPEAIRALFTKELPGYGELFRMLSYQEIGAAAMLSRAVGGVIGQKVALLMPGSTAAVRLAMEKLIVPEIAHLVEHARR